MAPNQLLQEVLSYLAATVQSFLPIELGVYARV